MANILIIEDSKDTRDLFTAMLEALGHHVQVAEHGLDGLHQLKAHPDLVLLDINMPVASGDVVLGFIRSTDDLKQTKVLVVSAHPDARRLANQLGADGVLQKPVELAELRAAINAILDVAQA